MLWYKKWLPKSMSTSFSSKLSSKSFIISEFTFDFLSWFFCTVWHKVQFHFLHAEIQFSQQHFGNISFPTVYFWHPWWRRVDCMSMGLFLGFLFCSIGVFIFLCQYHCFGYCSFVIYYAINNVIPLALLFLLKSALLLRNFYTPLPNPWKKMKVRKREERGRKYRRLLKVIENFMTSIGVLQIYT